MTEHLLFLLAAYISAVLATIAGFGSSTLMVPVAVFFMDIKTAVFVVACFHLFNNIFKIKVFWGKIDFNLFLRFGIPSILFAFWGAVYISAAPVDLIQKVLAIFLIVFSLLSLLRHNYRIKANMLNAVIGGCSSGFLAGLIGLGGALRASFLTAFNLPKEIYVATAAMIALVVDLTRIPTYVLRGTFENNVYIRSLPFLVICAYLGVKTGKALLNRIDHILFRRIVFVALLLVGIKLLF